MTIVSSQIPIPIGPDPKPESWLEAEVNSWFRWIEEELRNSRRKLSEAHIQLEQANLTGLRGSLLSAQERIAHCLYWVGREEEHQRQKASGGK